MKTRLHVVRRSLSTALLLAVASAGCASDPATEENPDIDPTDETAPAVSDTQPAASATAVHEDEPIRVTFSEPMDQASVEAAYASADLPADQVTFAWSPDGKVLTITSMAPLAYAEGAGTDPTMVTPKTFSITIGSSATDLAGNALAAPLDLSFSTRRRMIALFGIHEDLTRVTLGNTSYAMSELMIGDGATNNIYRSYVTFDLATLPAGAEVERAQFEGRQLTPTNAPYSLGVVNVQHVSYASTLGSVMNAAPATSLPGMMSNNAVLEPKKIDVTAQVIDDVTHRAERSDRSQYRLQIDVATNSNQIIDRANFARSSFVLGAIYVVD